MSLLKPVPPDKQVQTQAYGMNQVRSLLAQPWASVGVLLVFYLILVVLFSVLSPFFLTATAPRTGRPG